MFVMKLLATDRFILQPVLTLLSMAIYYILSVFCVPQALTTYLQGFDTFLLAHKVNNLMGISMV